jgi:two-component system cell cycle sensor histidine kinase/response regulator CckA
LSEHSTAGGSRAHCGRSNIATASKAPRCHEVTLQSRGSRVRHQLAVTTKILPFRELLESTPDAMVIVNEAGEIVLINSQTEKLFGYDREDLLGHPVERLIPARFQDRHRDQRAAYFSDPRVRALGAGPELYAIRKDGQEFPVEISLSPLKTAEGVLVTAAIRDISERKRVEGQIHKLNLQLQAKDQLQLLLDSTAEAIYSIDADGACTLCNASCLRLLGYSRDSELLTKNMHALMHHTRPDGRAYPEEECKILQAFRQGKGTHVTDEVLWRADGTSFPAEYWSYPVRHNGRAVGSVVTFFDITQRKKSEEALRRSESRYRSMIESAPYGIFRVDQNGCIAMANSALAAMLGYQVPAEVLGLNVGADVYLNSMEQQHARDHASEDPAVGYEAKWRRKDGKPITVRLGGRRLPDDDELPGGFEVFVEDITAHRSLQKQFEHSQKMEAVGRLAGGVAHDFNNLLMIIGGYAQLLDESPADPKKVVEYATRIQDASSKAATVTRQLLAFSRKQVLEPTVLDLSYVVKDLAKMLPRLLGEDVETVLELDPQVGTVRADRGQIEQVIVNLAVNARDAMPQGGRLTIATSNVALDASYYQGVEVPPGQYVLLAVNDTGVGMDATTQVHIFEPFYTTKEAGKGTGLGLAMVYGIVKQSQGFIWVYSEPDKGSIFKIYLPRVDAPADSEQSLQLVQAPSTGTETILLVEDEAPLRNVCRVYLESKGYTVLEAGNAKEAMKLCQSHDLPIHVLITDIVMPGLGGLELAKSALVLRPALSVVLVSGYTDRALDREAIGLAKFLQKPFSFDALARTVRSLLDKNREILLIEDSKFMRIAVHRALTGAGYTVHTANHGEAGLSAAREILPDLILLDLGLPTISGLDVLKALKRDAITKSIPVIVLSALSEQSKEELLNEGAAAWVEKSDKLLENDSLALIHTVTQIVGTAKATRG